LVPLVVGFALRSDSTSLATGPLGRPASTAAGYRMSVRLENPVICDPKDGHDTF
jgi:hypothetical protein